MRRELENVELARAGAEEIDEQQLRALLPALAEDPRSGPSTHVRRLKATY